MITEFDKTLAFRIRDMAGKLNRRLRKQVSNSEQMSITELNVIRLLNRNEQLSPSELCSQLNISSQYMSQVLNRLDKFKFISRKASLKDRRKTFISLSKDGKAKIQDARQEKEGWLAESIAGHYSDKDKKIIQKAIDLLLILPDL
jgi:DNA-binding MarR family transcriptional regulator